MNALAIIALALTAGLALGAAAPAPEAVSQQQSLARERMQDVERRLLELADLIEPQDPARAAALRRALTVSRQQFVVTNMADIESMLQGGNYGAAAQGEQQVLTALKQLGDILGQEAQPADVKALQAAQARLADLVKRQADAVARTQASPDADALRAAAQTQHGIASDAKSLADDLQGAPPSDELKAALSLMSDAEGALSGGRKAEAIAAQTAAQKQLEDASQALRAAIARQQQADQEQARAGLVTALQHMLDEQKAVRTETEGLGKEAAGNAAGRAYRLRAIALSEREKALGTAADGVLDSLAKDGTTVALPAALRQVKEDVAECATLLGDARTGPEVTAVQEGVESALAALIDAFQAAQQAQVKPPETPPQEQAPQRESRKPPLVDLGQQLKVLKALQLSVNAQTGRLDAQRGALDAEAARAQAARLATRQGDLLGVARSLEESASGGEPEP